MVSPDAVVTPFSGEQAEPPPSAAFDQPHEAVGETGFMDSPIIDDDPLPFSQAGEQQAKPDAAPSTALPFQEGGDDAAPPPSIADEPAHEAVGETGFMESPFADEPLPFDGDSAEDAPAAATPAAATPAAATPAAVTPAAVALAPELIALTIQQYASFCVERSADPDSLEATWARYKIADTAQQSALDQHWKQRLDGDADQRRAFEQHCAAFQEWLSQQSRQ